MLDAKAYLARCLDHDSEFEYGAIIELRRERRAIELEDEIVPRHELEAELSEIVEEFYDLTDESLEARLARIDASDHPDLERYRARLERVRLCRDEIERAVGDPDLSRRFMTAVRQVLIARQSAAQELKEGQRSAMTAGAYRRQAVNSVKRLRRQYPSLYALESGWFQHVKETPARIKQSAKPAWSGLGIIGIYFLVKLILFLFSQIHGCSQS